MKNITQIKKILWHTLPIVGAIIWGALSVTNYLWYDEAYTAALISKNFKELITITAKDVHSPFYYLLAKAFYHLCGGETNFWSLKLLSLLFSFAYLLLGKYVIEKLYNESTSIYFMLFSILMPILTVQSTNARMYSCGLFFLTATGLCMIYIYRGEESLLKWILLGICSICSVYCHTFQMIETLLLYAFLFITLLTKKNYKKLLGFFICGITVALAYLPWLKITYDQLQSRITQTSSTIAVAPDPEFHLYALITYCKEWFSAFDMPFASVMYLGMTLTIFLGYFALNYMRRNKDYIAGIGISVILITTLVGTFLNNNVAICFLGRYVFAAFGGLALLYAIGIQEVKAKIFKVCVFIIAFYCFIVQYRSELDLEYNTEIENYLDFVVENVAENDVIMIHPYHMLLLTVYYPEINYMAYGHLDEWMPFEVSDVFTTWEQLEDCTGTLWFISSDPGVLSAKYNYEEAIQFHHMYYDIKLYKMTPKSTN